MFAHGIWVISGINSNARNVQLLGQVTGLVESFRHRKETTKPVFSCLFVIQNLSWERVMRTWFCKLLKKTMTLLGLTKRSSREFSSIFLTKIPRKGFFQTKKHMFLHFSQPKGNDHRPWTYCRSRSRPLRPRGLGQGPFSFVCCSCCLVFWWCLCFFLRVLFLEVLGFCGCFSEIQKDGLAKCT